MQFCIHSHKEHILLLFQHQTGRLHQLGDIRDTAKGGSQLRITPFFSPGELLTSYLVTDENPRTGVFMNISEISQRMIAILHDVSLYTVLISDNRPSILRNVRLLAKVYPFTFHDFHGQNRLRVGNLEIERISMGSRVAPIFRVNGYLFPGNSDIQPMLAKLDPQLIILPSDGPISTVRNEIRLSSFRQEHSVLSRIV